MLNHKKCIQNHTKMNSKDLYEEPSITVVELKLEGVICLSSTDAGLQDYNWNNIVIE